MASEILVRADVDAGLTLVRALDEKAFGASAALWLYESDVPRWRFMVGYRGKWDELRKKIHDAAVISADWRKLHPDEPILGLDKVRIMPDSDKLIEALRPSIHVDGLKEVHYRQNMINGIYLEDALVHRLAA